MSIGSGGDLGSARGSIRIETDKSTRDVRSLTNEINNLGTGTQGSMQRATTSGYAFIGMGTAMLGVLGFGVTKAANFEKGIDAIAAVTGSTGEELDKLREKALQLGKDTAFSATEAASAMEELAKAGVSTEDILNGAADGAVALAAAAGTSLPVAAELISTALNQFGLGGEEATRVADLFAGAAAASAADATDIGEAFAYVGTKAHELGLSAEETTTALAILAQAGVKGSRGGTSLNSAIGNLATPIEKGAAALEKLGVSAYDASGTFRPLEDIVRDLNTATEGMTDKDKQDILGQIFDEQGMRAILPLLSSVSDEAAATGKDFDSMQAAVTKEGVAAEQAAARMDNLRGKIEELMGSVETIAINFGTVVLPLVTSVVEGITAGLNAIIGMGDGVATALALATGGLGLLTVAIGGFAVFGPQIARMGEAFLFLGKAMRALVFANPLLLTLAITIGLLTAAYASNFGGFRDWVDGMAKGLADFFGRFISSYRQMKQIFGGIGGIFAALGATIEEATGLGVTKQFFRLARTARAFGKGVDAIRKNVGLVGKAIKAGGLKAGFDAIFGRQGQGILAGFGKILGTFPVLAGQALRGIRTGIEPLDQIMYKAGRGVEFFGRAIQDVFRGDFRSAGNKALAGISSIAGAVRDAIPELIDLGQIAITGTFKLLGDLAGNIWEWIKGKLFGTHTEVSGPGAGARQVANDFDIIELGELLVNGTMALVDAGAPMVDSLVASITNAITAAENFIDPIAQAVVTKFKSIDWAKFVTVDSFTGGESFGIALRGLIAQGIDNLGEIDTATIGQLFEKIALASGKVTVFAATAIAGLGLAIVSFVAGTIKGLVWGEGDVDFTPMWQFIADGALAAVEGAAGAAETLAGAIADQLGMAFEAAGDEIKGRIPGWMKLAANGDWAGAIRALFGSGDNQPAGVGQDRPGRVGENIPPRPRGDGWFWDGQTWIKAGADLPVEGDSNGDGIPDSEQGLKFLPRRIDTGPLDNAGEAARRFSGALNRDTGTALATLGNNLKRGEANLTAFASMATRSGAEASQGFARNLVGGLQAAIAGAAGVTSTIQSILSMPGIEAMGFGRGAAYGLAFAGGLRSQIGSVSAAANDLLRAANPGVPNVPNGDGAGGGGVAGNGTRVTVINTTNVGLRSEELDDVLEGSRAGRFAGQFINEATNAAQSRVNSTRRMGI